MFISLYVLLIHTSCSFIHSRFLNTYYMLGIALGTGDTAASKVMKIPHPHGACVLADECSAPR